MRLARRIASNICLLIAIGSTSVFGDAALADEPGQLSEVVVTASKMGSESILRLPMAIQAMTGDSLEQRGAVDFNDYFREIPGLAVFDQGPGDKRYIIRGINASGASAVGLFLDDYIFTDENAQDGGGREPDLRLFDIDRVEVLKGPQGTTFGSSALSGVIRYIANKPDLQSYQATVRTAVTSQEHSSGLGVNTDMAVNLPIVEDRFAIRLAGYFVDIPGFINNRFENGVNNDQTWAARVMGRLKISDSLTLDMMYTNQDAETDGNPYYNKVDYFGNPLPPLTQANLVRTGFHDRMSLTGLTLEDHLEMGTITVVASEENRKTAFIRDSSQGTQVLYGLPDPAAEGVLATIVEPKDRTIDDIEARFASHLSGPFQFLTGVFAQWERRTFGQYIYAANSNGYIDPTAGILFGPIQFIDIYKTNIKEQAGFGEITWTATDKLKIIGGVRAFRFEHSFQPYEPISFGGTPGPGLGGKTTSSEGSAIGRFNASYTFSPDSLGYVQIAQGYRPSGSNDQIGAENEHAVIPAEFRSDSLINYEVGYKQSAFDKRLTVTTAVYRINWKNIQEQLQAPVLGTAGATFPYIGNGGAARVLGAELEVDVKPIDRLTVGLTGGYTNATVTEGVPGGGNSGDRIPYVPRFTTSVSADYIVPIGGSLNASFGGDVSYTDSRATDFPENTANYYRLPTNTLTNLRAGIASPVWKAEFLVKNAFHNGNYIDVFTVLPGLTTPGYIPNPPRTFWLQGSAKF